MPVSKYFNHNALSGTGEQALFESLIVESIQIMGTDIYYLPRESFDETDFILGETTHSKFDSAYIIEMYPVNVTGYSGDGDFFSKFGLEIRNNSNFIVARKTFNTIVPLPRPREGDLLYIENQHKLFEIKFVERDDMFYSLGQMKPYVYELRVEQFRFSNEQINTGIPVLDQIAIDNSYTIEISVFGGSNNFTVGEQVYQGANLAFATASAEVKTWDAANNKLRLINIMGTFDPAANVYGALSNTKYTVIGTDILGNFSDYDLTDNKQLKDEANTFIDLSETNPFGYPE